MTVKQYLENLYMRKYTTFRIKPDGFECYVIKGTEIPVSEFHEMFPLPLKTKPEKLNGATINLDGTKHYLHDD